MKRFLVKLLFFMLIPVVYFAVMMTTNYFIYNSQQNLVKNKHILIIGDSHPQRSLNPEYMSGAQNISQPAEPYFITFWKLKKITQSYTPDTLIIGFAPHNISEFNDFKLSDGFWSAHQFKMCYSIEEFKNLPKNIFIDYKTFYKVLWKQTAFYPKRNHANYIGGYTNNTKSNVKDWEIASNRHFYYNGNNLGVSEVAVNYLDSIVSLAKSKKIKTVMVNNPVHEKYLEKIPPKIMKRYDQLKEKYKTSVIMFDKTTDKYPDSLLLNADHLNEYGAKRFTNELNDYINSIKNNL
ncbi:hypothetical protein M0G43_13855 [Subsaxibacter sp. CAU 1640]|uniref:hypothetical protein n=1 Tax=Subsaxibacter sp. CAU 1640 TaxID=2933271 RepID=UPI0020039DF2|nr:hypothetical protein [Subsaxibacter sp. CAU 1640]MCK7591668.1 hypothetical protein [Subsaxibacter sp. CAU 1640]